MNRPAFELIKGISNKKEKGMFNLAAWEGSLELFINKKSPVINDRT